MLRQSTYLQQRIFLAALPRPTILKELVSFQQALKKSKYFTQHNHQCRWVCETDLHLTLHFLGSLEKSQLKKLLTGLEFISASPRHEQILNRVAFFPHPARATVSGLGGQPASSSLMTLWKRIGSFLEESGLELPFRPFYPHVSLVRFKTSLELTSFKEENLAPSPQGIAYWVEAVAVMESQPNPSGARYRLIQEFPLAAGH